LNYKDLVAEGKLKKEKAIGMIRSIDLSGGLKKI